MPVYYAIITAVVALSYIILKKYLAVHKNILLCFSAYVLMCLFPVSVTGIGTGSTIAVYLLAAVLVAYLVNNFEINTGESSGRAETANKETAAAAITAETSDLYINDPPREEYDYTEIARSVTAESDQQQGESELKREIKTEVELSHDRQDDLPEEDLSMEMTAGEENMEVESNLEEDSIKTEDGIEVNEDLEVFNEAGAEAVAAQDDEEIDKEIYEQIDEIDEELDKDELPCAYSHTEIVRSVVEEDMCQHDEYEEISPDKPEEDSLSSCEESADQQDESEPAQVQEYGEELTSEDSDTAADQQVKEDPEEAAGPLTAKALISQGLENFQSERYDKALKLLLKGLKEQPELELKYLAVSKISDIYQHMGIYELAAGIIAAYLNQEDLAEHPGTKAWREKLVYLDNLMKVMRENNISNVPYNQLPDFVKKKAFFRAMKKINK
ncbi:MAG: hypothetical protein H0Z40_11080 [Desulfotomaculum sp.]|nr:hypothetical protein [Desulfotomaculum sp.]